VRVDNLQFSLFGRQIGVASFEPKRLYLIFKIGTEAQKSAGKERAVRMQGLDLFFSSPIDWPSA
jgi:hypothetical protein